MPQGRHAAAVVAGVENSPCERLSVQPVLRPPYRAGEKAFVDYAGPRFPVVNGTPARCGRDLPQAPQGRRARPDPQERRIRDRTRAHAGSPPRPCGMDTVAADPLGPQGRARQRRVRRTAPRTGEDRPGTAPLPASQRPRQTPPRRHHRRPQRQGPLIPLARMRHGPSGKGIRLAGFRWRAGNSVPLSVANSSDNGQKDPALSHRGQTLPPRPPAAAMRPKGTHRPEVSANSGPVDVVQISNLDALDVFVVQARPVDPTVVRANAANFY